MDFGFTAEDQAFRADVISFLDRELTPGVAEELDTQLGPGPETRKFYKKLGERGWITVTWPKKYGGIEGTNIQRLIVAEELGKRHAYYALVAASMTGPTILLFGTDEQKMKFLPPISKGDVDFSLGYTEPQAGSDLAALDIRAVDDGDDFVINGQKMFSTSIHYSQYHWLAARTDPEAPKHKGVSLIIVPTDSPGISISPLYALNGRRTNVVYYDNVRVPKSNLVGQRNRGFYHIAAALEYERMYPMGDMWADLYDLAAYVKETERDGQPLAKDPLVRQRLGEMVVEFDAVQLLSYWIASMIDGHQSPGHLTSQLKAYISETRKRFGIAAMDITGLPGQLWRGGARTPMNGNMAYAYLEGFVFTIVGGTSEVQRNIIAQRGLGLPKD